MISPTIALRNAVRPVLLGTNAISLLIADRLHDRVPAGQDKAVFPYGAFGPMRMDRAEVGCWANGWQVKLRLYAASNAYERDEAWEIAQTITLALEGTRPVLAGHYQLADDLRVGMIGDAIDVAAPRAVFFDVGAFAYAP